MMMMSSDVVLLQLVTLWSESEKCPLEVAKSVNCHCQPCLFYATEVFG